MASQDDSSTETRPRGWTHEQVNEMIGSLLRAGVLVSASVVFVGGALFLLRHGFDPPHYRVFQGEPPDYRRLGGILMEAVALKGRGIILLGMLFLIATPVARVALSILTFARQRDLSFVFITSLVLAILLFSLLFGRF
jgi:uncharacterized membrane protein